MSCFDVFAAGLTSPFFREYGHHKRADHLNALANLTHSDLLGLYAPSTKPPVALSSHGFQVCFEFILRRNYISKDDPSYYPTDNPIRREHIFKVPMVSGATWKGGLRTASVELLLALVPLGEDAVVQRRLDLWHLFGDEKGYVEPGRSASASDLTAFLDEKLGGPAKRRFHERLNDEEPGVKVEDWHFKGRLHCLPTYFKPIGQDVLNPRNRKTRAGSNPISMEVVRKGTGGMLSLLYFPFDLVGADRNTLLIAKRNDWTLIAESVKHMMSISGFGGKKSSGCGTANFKGAFPDPFTGVQT